MAQSGMTTLEHLLHQAQIRAARKANEQALLEQSQEDEERSGTHPQEQLDNFTTSAKLISDTDADKNLNWILNRSIQLNKQSSASTVTFNHPTTSSSSHEIVDDLGHLSNDFSPTSIANVHPISNNCDAAESAARTMSLNNRRLESPVPDATINHQSAERHDIMNATNHNNSSSSTMQEFNSPRSSSQSTNLTKMTSESVPVEKDRVRTKLDMDAAVALAIQRLEEQKARDEKLEHELKHSNVDVVLLDVQKENYVLSKPEKEEISAQRHFEIPKSTKRQTETSLPTSEVKLTKYNSSSDVIKKFKEKWATDREELQRVNTSATSSREFTSLDYTESHETSDRTYKLGSFSSKALGPNDHTDFHETSDYAYSSKLKSTSANQNENSKIQEMEQRLALMENQLLSLHNENSDLAHKLQDAAETISNAVLLTSSKQATPHHANDENDSLRRHVENLEKEIEMLKRNIVIQNRTNIPTTNLPTSIARADRDKAMQEHSLVMQQAVQALNYASSVNEQANKSEPRELTPMWFNNVQKSYNIRGQLTSETELANSKNQTGGALFKERNGRAKIIGLPESPDPPSSLITSPHYSQSEDDDEFLIVMTPRSAEKKAQERAQHRLKELTEQPVVLAPRQRSAEDEKISQRIQQLFSKFPIKRTRDGDPTSVVNFSDPRRKSSNDNHQQQHQYQKDAEVKSGARISKPWSAKEALAADSKAYETVEQNNTMKKSRDLENTNPIPVPPWILKKRQMAAGTGMGQRSVSTSDLSNLRAADKPPPERKSNDYVGGNDVGRTAISKSLSNQLKNFLNSASPRPQPKVNVYTLGRRIFDSHESTKHGSPVKAIHMDLSKSQNLDQHQSMAPVDNLYHQSRTSQLTRSYEDPSFELRRAASLRDNSKRVQFSDKQQRMPTESADKVYRKPDPSDTTWSDADEMELRERVRGLLHRQRDLGTDVTQHRHIATNNTPSSFARTAPKSNDNNISQRTYPYEQVNKKKTMSPVPPLNLDAFHLDSQDASIGAGTCGGGGGDIHQRNFDISLEHVVEQENFRSRQVTDAYVNSGTDVMTSAHQYSNDLLKKYAYRH